MSFIERYKTRPLKSIIQISSIDEDLRNSLWNCLLVAYFEGVDNSDYDYTPDLITYTRTVWTRFFKLTLDNMPERWNDYKSKIKNYFYSFEWDEVYEFLEFSARYYPDEDKQQTLVDCCNVFLEQELSAYRFVDKKILKITDEIEIAEIEEALDTNFSGAKIHLKKAIELFSDKHKPDYSNTIKESISAVEHICRELTGESTLGKALKKIQTRIDLNDQLRDGLEKIYGYTNNHTDGIRHAFMSTPKVGFEEAKFMLVTCSAFVNYLSMKAQKVNTLVDA